MWFYIQKNKNRVMLKEINKLISIKTIDKEKDQYLKSNKSIIDKISMGL